jgi:hypothetical protein
MPTPKESNPMPTAVPVLTPELDDVPELEVALV